MVTGALSAQRVCSDARGSFVASRSKAENLPAGLDTLDSERGGFEAPPCTSGKTVATGFCFDTNLRGNSNGGHEYGVELSANDKAALLAYLLTF
jgi:hypothetical protein